MADVAIVTGASSGIGAATAVDLARRGFDVIAAARRVDRLDELAAAHPAITPWELDVTDQASVDALLGYVADKPVRVLVANAGGAFDASVISDADLDGWATSYELNVVGLVRTIKAFMPQLIASGDGILVIMGSTAGRVVYETGGSYTASKHAVTAIAETLRLELCGEPVRVTEIAPGMVKTEEFSLNRFGGDQAKADAIYAGVAEPLSAEDVAEAVGWVTTLPSHVNIDVLVMRPRAQAAQYKVHRVFD